jgi:hypothetical protein
MLIIIGFRLILDKVYIDHINIIDNGVTGGEFILILNDVKHNKVPDRLKSFIILKFY